MTHGTSGSIYGTDGKTVAIEEIKKQFNGENFPAMADKPKVLLIQACRGGNAAFWSVTVTAGIKIYLLFVQYIYQTHRFQSTHDTQTNSYPGQLASKKSSLLVKWNGEKTWSSGWATRHVRFTVNWLIHFLYCVAVQMVRSMTRKFFITGIEETLYFRWKRWRSKGEYSH